MNHIPLRRCMACQTQKEKKDLIRIVKTPEGTIRIDNSYKQNGRGAYICRQEECLNKIIKSKRLERVLNTTIDDAIYEEIRGIINGK